MPQSAGTSLLTYVRTGHLRRNWSRGIAGGGGDDDGRIHRGLVGARCAACSISSNAPNYNKESVLSLSYLVDADSGTSRAILPEVRLLGNVRTGIWTQTCLNWQPPGWCLLSSFPWRVASFQPSRAPPALVAQTLKGPDDFLSRS